MTTRQPQADQEVQELHRRLQRYGEERLRALEALEMAGSVSTFDCSLNKLESHVPILEETAFKCHTLTPCTAMCFCLIDEQDNDLAFDYCTPRESRPALEREVEALIQDGDFAWALERNRPHILRGRHVSCDLLLHTLSTPSRIRGMFLAFLARKRATLEDITLSLLSVVMHSCAHMLESYTLYSLLRADSLELEQRLRNSRQAQQLLDNKQERLQRRVLRLEADLHEAHKQLASHQQQQLPLTQDVPAATQHQELHQEMLQRLLQHTSDEHAARCLVETCMHATDSQEGLLGFLHPERKTLQCRYATPGVHALCGCEQKTPPLDRWHDLGNSGWNAFEPFLSKAGISTAGREQEFLLAPLPLPGDMRQEDSPVPASLQKGVMLLTAPCRAYCPEDLEVVKHFLTSLSSGLFALAL